MTKTVCEKALYNIDKGPYFCTLKEGHDGRHEAHTHEAIIATEKQ